MSTWRNAMRFEEGESATRSPRRDRSHEALPTPLRVAECGVKSCGQRRSVAPFFWGSTWWGRARIKYWLGPLAAALAPRMGGRQAGGRPRSAESTSASRSPCFTGSVFYWTCCALSIVKAISQQLGRCFNVVPEDMLPMKAAALRRTLADGHVGKRRWPTSQGTGLGEDRRFLWC